MNFISELFVAFFLVTLSVYLCLPERYRQAWLLLMSYVFYATWSIPFIGVIIVTTSLDYYISRYIAASTNQNQRKLALTVGIVMNLLILIFFKYANFLASNVNGLWTLWGQKALFPDAFNIILPLGISFYTFEAISYMVDVYRGNQPAKNWLDYNFYIMYFPHLISGPIIRFSELASQYRDTLKLPSLERFNKATELVVLGFVYKMLLADQAAGLADTLFTAPAAATSLMTWVGVLAFTVQIYFDFMGYTHIARGASLFFNIELPINFNHPYVASNISNFWERWHISLSRWIRDYLYIPLGGSRVSLPHTCWNLFLTMLIAGAWHGAGWTFILWGAYHGALLALNHAWRYIQHALPGYSTWAKRPLYQGMSISVTFLLVVIGWVLFRATDLSAVGIILQKLASVQSLAVEVVHLVQTAHFTSIMQAVLLLVACFIGPWAVKLREACFEPLSLPVKAVGISLLLIICWIFASTSSHPFIYFQF